MNFQDTWPLLQKGKCLGRASSKEIIYLIPKISNIWAINMDNTSMPDFYRPTIQDLLANDWQVVE